MNSVPPISEADKARIAYSCRHGAEERAVCAILHATSLYIPYVLIPSGIVWGLQRSRSQFLAVQSLQALMYQLVVFLGQLAGFGLFMFGFIVAISSGLGVAMILGLGAIFLFQMVFPLCGVWAAVRILRGHEFRYPILGRLAVSWSSQQSINVEASSTSEMDTAENSDSETVLAALVHLSLLGGLGPILTPILWATTGRRSRFLTDQMLQAAFFQLAVAGIMLLLVSSFGAIVIFLRWFGSLLPVGVTESITRFLDSPLFFLCWVGVLGLLMLIAISLAVNAAIRAFRGCEFRYPIVGFWLARYLDK